VELRWTAAELAERYGREPHLLLAILAEIVASGLAYDDHTVRGFCERVIAGDWGAFDALPDLKQRLFLLNFGDFGMLSQAGRDRLSVEGWEVGGEARPFEASAEILHAWAGVGANIRSVFTANRALRAASMANLLGLTLEVPAARIVALWSAYLDTGRSWVEALAHVEATGHQWRTWYGQPPTMRVGTLGLSVPLPSKLPPPSGCDEDDLVTAVWRGLTRPPQLTSIIFDDSFQERVRTAYLPARQEIDATALGLGVAGEDLAAFWTWYGEAYPSTRAPRHFVPAQMVGDYAVQEGPAAAGKPVTAGRFVAATGAGRRIGRVRVAEGEVEVVDGAEKPRRAYIAIEIKGALGEAWPPTAVPPHVTLAYVPVLPENKTTDETLAALVDAVQGVLASTEPFELRFAPGASSFTSEGSDEAGQTVWAKIPDEASKPKLEALMARVQDTLTAAGYKVSTFAEPRPHATLAFGDAFDGEAPEGSVAVTEVTVTLRDGAARKNKTIPLGSADGEETTL
jgi:2'-5' RNA ligase